MIDPNQIHQLKNALGMADQSQDKANHMTARAQAIACLALKPGETFEFGGREELQQAAAKFLTQAFDWEATRLAPASEAQQDGTTTIAGMLRGR